MAAFRAFDNGSACEVNPSTSKKSPFKFNRALYYEEKGVLHLEEHGIGRKIPIDTC